MGSTVLRLAAVECPGEGCGDDAGATADAEYAAGEFAAADQVVALRP